ncbi:hypothetical protein XENTR_v10004577 [Xenopus tropicalis]|nr:hypothetical protein XENTR_v10004577 [Xenopus tropicalis]
MFRVWFGQKCGICGKRLNPKQILDWVHPSCNDPLPSFSFRKKKSAAFDSSAQAQPAHGSLPRMYPRPGQFLASRSTSPGYQVNLGTP